MAGYGYPTTGYGYYNFNPSYQPAAVPLPQPQQQNQGNLMTIQVTTEDEVTNYPVAAGTTVLLISFNLKKFWLKSTSTSGVPQPIRVFPFEETIRQAGNQNDSNGVTREEFNTLSAKLDKLIANLGGDGSAK